MEIGDLITYRYVHRTTTYDPIGVVVEVSNVYDQSLVYWLDIGLYSWVYNGNLVKLNV